MKLRVTTKNKLMDIEAEIKRRGGLTLHLARCPSGAEVGQQREFQIQDEDGHLFLFLGELESIENVVVEEKGFVAPLCILRIRLIKKEEYH